MSLAALALVVAAAFIHVYWNLLVKRAEGGPAFVWLFSVATAALYAPIVILLLVLQPLNYGWREWMLIFRAGSFICCMP